jgi:hypothetical protein
MDITIQHCFAKHLLLWLSYKKIHIVKALCFIGCYLINFMFFLCQRDIISIRSKVCYSHLCRSFVGIDLLLLFSMNDEAVSWMGFRFLGRFLYL